MVVGVAVPCYNEANRWDNRYWKPLFAAEQTRWILVNDGSSDDTESVLRACSSENVSLLSLSSNVGKGEAVRTGLLQLISDGAQWVGFVDADGAFADVEILRFIDMCLNSPTEFASLWSSRVRMRGRKIERQKYRHVIGRSIAGALSARYPGLPYDSQSGMKFFRVTPQLLESLSQPFQTKWLFDVELYARLESAYGQDSSWLWEEPLRHWRHVSGSKISVREFSRVQREVLQLMLSPREPARHPVPRNSKNFRGQ